MNKSVKYIIKNIGYSFSANALMMLCSVISVIVFPKLLGLQEYGMWQLYLFYFSFCGFLPLGWLDGIYLRYGGKSFNNLNGKLLSLQFILFIIFSLLELGFIYILANILINDYDKLYVIKYLLIMLSFYLPFSYLKMLLQATGEIEQFAKLIFFDRLIFITGAILSIILVVHITNEFMIADILAKFIVFLISIYYCVSLLKSFNFIYWKRVLKDIYSNIYIGYNLMFANIASLLIFGIIRFGISQEWDIITFGKISLTFSICNFLVVFINSASIVLFPIIKNISLKVIQKTYGAFNFSLTFFLLLCLFLYYPLKEILYLWLPKFEDSLIYMSILFPICLFESKMALLISTYLKALRKEKELLRINIFCLGFSLILTFISVYVLHLLDLTVFCIIIIIAFRNILAELYMNKILKLKNIRSIIFELIIVFAFISSNYLLTTYTALIIYTVVFLISLLFVKKDIIRSYKTIKTYLK